MRDIDSLCLAGIPIVTTQGGDGGISIMQGYNLDTTVFTKDELQAIFIGLKSVDSVSKTPVTKSLSHKFGENYLKASDNMTIDLASFYKDSLSNKIELLNSAISNKNVISFHYFYEKGESDKKIEPYQIIFKWSDWYIFGWCCEREDFRLYKLKLLWELKVCDENFSPREIPENKRELGTHITDDYFITAIFESSEKYKLVEEYGPNSFEVLPNGKLKIHWGFTNPDKAVLWFLNFGDKVEVIEPKEFVEKLKNTAENILDKYK